MFVTITSCMLCSAFMRTCVHAFLCTCTKNFLKSCPVHGFCYECSGTRDHCAVEGSVLNPYQIMRDFSLTFISNFGQNPNLIFRGSFLILILVNVKRCEYDFNCDGDDDDDDEYDDGNDDDNDEHNNSSDYDYDDDDKDNEMLIIVFFVCFYVPLQKGGGGAVFLVNFM